MTQSTSPLTAELPPSSPLQPIDKAGKVALDADSRRNRLREFQSHLLERMQAARSGSEAQESQLGLLIGQSRWLLNLQEAGEIVAVEQISRVPLTHDWYLGLSNVRGTLISVIDFARYQGQALTQIDKECRIVAFAPTFSFNSGLLVSRVLGLRNVAQMTLQAPDSLDQAAPKRYIDSDSQIWSELSMAQILQDPRFLQVGL
ncbi:type IV pili signal transduction protein PilI [Collimonas arenae]|uniref:Type IV pili signal transduction protein PilI n=1 Tax=Collimonas arenae TaxID=279058 RepID=A0A0A1F668_9BURK|nr:chemotaxis protein CheW [Collimonas arenae]AIY40036.1 type IV pili signal transduction protein PilI [Collimonas arenae]